MIKEAHYKCHVCDHPCDIYMSYDESRTRIENLAVPNQCIIATGIQKAKWVRHTKVTKVIKPKGKKIARAFNIGSLL